MNHDPAAAPECSESGCADDAAFYVYDADSGDWRSVCTPHARHLHPSLEVHAWLESGYMKPAELGEPDGPPPDPPGKRGTEFRVAVEEAMGWTR